MTDISPLGRIVLDDDRAAIVMECRYPHPIEKVWAALTDPKQLTKWMGPAKVDGRVGGTITLEGGPQDIPAEVRRMTGQILVWDPPTVLEYEWRQAIVDESVVRYELASDGEGEGAGTLLKFTQRWLSLTNARGFLPGQHAYLDRLAAHLDGAEIPDWRARYAEVKPIYAWTE